MDFKYYDITHKWHLICNPMSKTKFEELCGLLRLRHGAQVLDIACGKGEFLIRLAELYDISGIGVDISPYCIRDCRRKHRERMPDADLKFVEMDGADYRPELPESFDLTMCIGASWVYKGHKGTLQALKNMTKPTGMIMVGEPYWVKEPSEEYLLADKAQRDDFGSHDENVQAGEAEGLTCLYTLVSNHDDWDHYESLQWWASNEYVRNHPDDPDVPELLERKKREKEIYLRWGRETLGWAIYLFRKL